MALSGAFHHGESACILAKFPILFGTSFNSFFGNFPYTNNCTMTQFMFSKKATKIEKISILDLTLSIR